MAKKIQFSDFEMYLIKQAVEAYKEDVLNQEFPKNSFITKEYVESMLSEILEKVR